MKKSLLFSSLLFSAWSFAIVNFISGDFPVLTSPDKEAATTANKTVAKKNESATVITVDGTFPIAAESSWKYNDSGTDLGTSWKEVSYDDAAWASGNGKLGYGDASATLLSYGPDAANKYPTYYFRYAFEAADVDVSENLVFRLLKDDGAVVYVNGTEVFRSNMPEGAVTYNTFASSTIGGSDETVYTEFVVPNTLQNGTNVIAVELHQADASSSDLGFDMEVFFQPLPLGPTPYPVAKGSEWYYLDNGTSLDAVNWNEAAYDVTSWVSGFATLGYGDPMTTTVSFGPDASNKYITTYYVKDVTVNLTEVADFVEFGLRRDDGAIVYVNGTEMFRTNMPEGAVDYLTHSATIVDGADEKRFFTYKLPKTIFQEGVNRIAVEMHNRDGQSSDTSFDLYIKDAPEEVECNEPHIACFTSIVPTSQSNMMQIPQEHRFQMIFKQGEEYTDGSGTVPGNHDYTAYVASEGSSELGYLAINHENSPGGVSVLNLHLNTDDYLWVVDESKPVDFYNDDLVTTVRNCSGGITPWGTVITAEETTNSGDVNGDGYEDVGWLVEINPITGEVVEYGNGKQEKLWAMGRMGHENVVVTEDGTTAYYGEDGGTQCVYKFVADTPGDLSEGTVYVLQMDLPLSNDEPSSSTATWIQVPNATQEDRNNIRNLAAAVGGTNFNGVEDCEISPLDGKVYFTSKGKNRTYSFKDDGDTVSGFETFVGGMSYPIETPQGTFSTPWGNGNDNLTFDDKGNLWVLQDGSNNQIWVVAPDHTQSNPKVSLFATMPAGSEPTGLTFTPDFKYGFFSIQHPSGNNSPQVDATLSNVTFNASATVVFALRENLGIQAPVTDFMADQVVVSEGETVTFTDMSTNNPTSWAWTFEGGTPETSTEENPVVTYAEAGTYTVTLATGNIAGESEEVKTEYIVVEQELGLENSLAGLGVSIYPNPTQGNVNISLNDEAGKNVSAEVYDLLGRKVTEVSGITTTGSTQDISLNLNDVKGEQVLIIKLTVGDKTGTYKLIKSN